MTISEKTLNRVVTLFVIGTFSSLLFVIPVSTGLVTPIDGPLILSMSRDNAVSRSVRLLQDNIEKARVIQINTPFELYLTMKKAVGEVFYVGHATEDGLITNMGMITWNNVITGIHGSRAQQHYLLSCYSEKVTAEQFSSTKLVIGFHGLVESELGALTVLAYYHCVQGHFARYIGFAVQTIIKANTPGIRTYLGKVTYHGLVWHQFIWPIKYEHPSRDAGDNTPNGISHWDDTVLLASNENTGPNARHLSITTINQIKWSGTIAATMAAIAWTICSRLAIAALLDPEVVSKLVLALATAISAIIAILLGLLGVWWHIVVATLICDETGLGWYFMKNIYINPYAVLGQVVMDYYQKWGCDQWFHTNHVLGWVPVTLGTGTGYQFIRSASNPL